jgi:hypothetical protein
MRAMTPFEPRVGLGILFDRLQRLVRLDTSVFDEVRQDTAATMPAALVLVLSTFLSGVGGWLWWLVKDFGDSGTIFIQSVVLGTVFSVALWIVWLLVAWVILTQLFREEADWQQMLRTMGMAAAPLAISVVMFVPGIDFGIALASVALFFGLTTIAIQAVTTASAARVLVANLVGFGVWAMVLGLFVNGDSYLAPGIFLMNAPVDKIAEFSGGIF